MHVKEPKEWESSQNSIENCFTENLEIEFCKNIRFSAKLKL
jgi:hypothetical protein